MRHKVSGATLKIIAIVSMLIDHIGAAVIEPILESPNHLTNSQFTTLLHIDYILRDIGRLAFPMFCFLIVEGFMHTHNWKKYFARLCVFAAISEIPFDLAFMRKPFSLEAQNVFFTLALGLLTIALTQIYRERFNYRNEDNTLNIVNLLFYTLATLVTLFSTMAISMLLHSDYNAPGIAAIFIIYIFYPRRRYIGFIIAILFLTVIVDESEIFALLNILFIYMYNGTKGRQLKYLFYLFYPVHLALLAGLATYFIGKI
jgi:hypothetical protein